ncbi:Laminin-like protein epi-1 [Termitomyces sp. T112]|nr:Laminin-like protein epi-1 [Termitomyces sp. T112]KAH0590886.1 hypothetical protein H2248_001002 [Termitomyces sp. 'cryptogamus']
MSEVEPQITAPTQDDSAELESGSDSADLVRSVASSHGGNEAVKTDDTEQPVDVISNVSGVPFDIADLETENAVGEPISENPDTIARVDVPTKGKPSSAKIVAGKPNGGPPTPLVKKIINSGTFGTGAVGKAPTKPAGTDTKSIKPSIVPALSRSTSSSAAVPSKASMTAIARTPAAPSRRLSVVPAKPTAPPMSKPTLSASNAKTSSGSANSKSATSTRPATIATNTKLVSSTSATRPSAVSPTGSTTSTSARPKSAVFEGVKRPTGASTSRQSLPVGIKPPLALSSSGKLPLARSSASATTTRPTRATTSISSIREVKEDNKVLEDLQAQLKDLTESLEEKSKTVIELEGRIGKLASALEAVQTDLASKSVLAEQLDQDKSFLQKQLSETKNALLSLESGGQDNESTIATLRQQVDAAKVASAAQEETIRGLRTQIQALNAQVNSTQDALDSLKDTIASNAEKAGLEHEAFLKTSAELAAAVAEIDVLKEAHGTTILELEDKIKIFEAKSGTVDALGVQLAGLKAEKEENSGKLSELEIEILELKESQETIEEEREKLLAQVKTLEAEVDKATAATNQAYEKAKAKEVEVAVEVAKLKEAHDALLKVEIEKQDGLNASIEVLKADLAAAQKAHEQTKADALSSMEVYNRKIAEAETDFTRRQSDLSEEIKRLTKELENQENHYDAQVTAVKEEHKQLLQEVFERAKAEAGDVHAHELQALRASSTASIEQLQATNRSALEDIKTEHTNLLDSEVSRLEKIIATLKLDLKATQDDLVKAKTGLETARAEVRNLTQQRDDARASASSASDSAAQVEEITRLSKELAIAKDDLAATNEMLSLTKISLTELSNNQAKDLEEAAKGRAEEVTKLRVAHDEEVSALVAQKSELAIKVSDLEGEVVTLRASIESERATPKTNGNGIAPPVSPGVTKEELQRLHEAHNLKIHDLAAEHDKVIRALKDELEVAHNKAEELNAEVQRKVMEIQYLEQDQEENQDQITRLTEERDGLLHTIHKDQTDTA